FMNKGSGDFPEIAFPSLSIEYVNAPPPDANGVKFSRIEYQLFVKALDPDNQSTLPSGNSLISATAEIGGLRRSMNVILKRNTPVDFLYYVISF
ncbi:hypothetical protein HZA38_02520, partial [Candidatus Peregrinibacteria bacterium]|nr:hypothetical protein [Candidatus Peregrinibacteria bacterium]